MDTSLVIQAVHEAEIGVVLTAGGWLLMFPIRNLAEKVKKFLESYEHRLDRMESELTTQRTNCLATLQKQGDEQIKTLDRMASTLDKMHESQIEMTGYWKGMNHRP